MVLATLRAPDGTERRVHWPRDYSPAEMQRRACRAFDLNFREYRVAFTYEGRALGESSLPFLSALRHSKAIVFASFEQIDQEKDEVEDDDEIDDVSSGCSTPEDIAAEVDRLDLFPA